MIVKILNIFSEEKISNVILKNYFVKEFNLVTELHLTFERKALRFYESRETKRKKGGLIKKNPRRIFHYIFSNG